MSEQQGEERVALNYLRDLQAEWMEAIREADRIYEELLEATGERLFCDNCGRVEPPCGFYPLGIHGPDSVSGLWCNDCRRPPREEQ